MRFIVLSATIFWNHDVEDNAYAIMRSGAGIVAMLHSSATQWRHRFHLDIHLEKGAITLSGILSGSKSYGSETITISHKRERLRRPHLNRLHDTIQMILGNWKLMNLPIAF